jgi:hypothetical protein
MAEVIGVVASILQIAGAGVHLTMELYNFGTTFAGAKEDTDDIALGVSLYCMTLKQLAEKIQHKDAVQSSQALQSITDIKEKSEQVFARIAAILPKSAGRSDSMTLVQRFKWNFKKARVNLLLGQLDSLKLTLLLLVQIFNIGEETQKSKPPQYEAVATSSSVEQSLSDSDAAIQTEMLHAVVLNKQRHLAIDHLVNLQAAAEKEDKTAIDAAPSDPPMGFVPIAEMSSALVKYHDQTLLRLDRIMSQPDAVDHMALVVYMLDQWTVVRYKGHESQSGLEQGQGPQRSRPSHGHSRRSSDGSTSARKSEGNRGNFRAAFVEDEDSSLDGPRPRRSTTVHQTELNTDPWRIEELSDDDKVGPLPQLRRRATTSGAQLERSRPQKLSAHRRETIAADWESLFSKSNKNGKITIRWRRGNDHAWREFKGEKLKDFKVNKVLLNVNQAHFQGNDTWTEFVKTHAVTVTTGALVSNGYRFYEYERFSHTTYASYDENGNGQGEATHHYDSVIRVKLPLVYVSLASLRNEDATTHLETLSLADDRV